MTVNDYKETSCASAGPVEDLMKLELKFEGEIALPVVPLDTSENLLGRVLEGKYVSFKKFVVPGWTLEEHLIKKPLWKPCIGNMRNYSLAMLNNGMLICASSLVTSFHFLLKQRQILDLT